MSGANTFQSIEAIEEALAQGYRGTLALLPDLPREEVQRRFEAHHVWPRLGWGLIAVGVSQFEATDDPRPLCNALHKFVALSYGRCEFDAEGIGAGGHDYCGLVPNIGYVAALKRFDLVGGLFSMARPPSRRGYPSYRHAANLLVGLVNPEWPHREATRSDVERYSASKSPGKVDKAFVGFFGSLAFGTPPRAELHVLESMYCRSNWGQYKPYSKPVFLAGLLSLADHYRPGLLSDEDWLAALGPEWRKRWSALDKVLPSVDWRQFDFGEDLAFLNLPTS